MRPTCFGAGNVQKSPGTPFRGERPLGPPSGGSCRCSRVDSFVRFRALAVRSHVFPEHPGYGLSHSPCCRYAQITPLWPVGGFQRLRGRPPRAQAARAVPSRSVPLFPGTARCSGPRVHVPPALYTRPRLQGAAATLIGERCQKMKTRELGVLAAAGRSPRAGVADGAPGASGTRAPPRERPPATLCSTRNERIGSYASRL